MKKTSRLKLAATVFTVARATSRPGSASVAERAQCVPRLVRATLDRSYTGVAPARLALVAAAALYVASPVDLVPESVLPIVGLADDALVLRWAVRAFVEETDRFLVWEARRGAWAPGGRPPPPRPERDATGAAAPGQRAEELPLATWSTGSTGSTVAGMREAARVYLLEAARRRLER